MSKLNAGFRSLFARCAAFLCAMVVVAAPALEGKAAPVGYVYYLQTFGDWTVTCGRDESSGRDNCTLSAPPPERHGESQIEIGDGQNGNDAVIVRVRGALMPESPIYLRIDAQAPHQTQPNRFGEGRWNGTEADAIIAELNSGQRAVVRTFSGPPPAPRDAFFSLERFNDALADLDRRTSGKQAETAQAAPPEAQPRTEAAAPVTAPPVAPPPVTQPPAATPQPPQQAPSQPPPQPAPQPAPPTTQAQPQQTPPQPPREEPAPPRTQPVAAGEAVAILDEAHVGRARLTTNVVNREPVDQLGSRVDIPSSGEDFVYFFTEIRGMAGRTVTHRWQYGGNVVASVPFQIGSDRWRVYSRKGIAGGQTGPWTVTAVGPNGSELARATFTAE
jgi:hypothetical protein